MKHFLVIGGLIITGWAVLASAPASAQSETAPAAAEQGQEQRKSVLVEQIEMTQACAEKRETDPAKCAIVNLVEDCLKGEKLIEEGANNKEMTKGFRMCRNSADKGSVTAQASVGNYYLIGIKPILKVDYKKAREYLERAAAGGHPQALFNLGVMYDTGKGVRPSSDNAMRFYLKSAQFGHVKAQLSLAEMLVNQALDKKDRTLNVGKATEGLFWACLAASSTHAHTARGQAMCDMLAEVLPRESVGNVHKRLLDAGVAKPYLQNPS